MAAVAIPLRKATSCGRAQDLYAHPCGRLECGRGVGVDLTIQSNFFELRCGPFHDRKSPQNNINCPSSIPFSMNFIDQNFAPRTSLILKDLTQGYLGTCPLSS